LELGHPWKEGKWIWLPLQPRIVQCPGKTHTPRRWIAIIGIAEMAPKVSEALAIPRAPVPPLRMCVPATRHILLGLACQHIPTAIEAVQMQ